MMTKATKGIRNNIIKLDAFYTIVGVVVAFTVATVLLILYITLPSFDYKAFAQEENNETVADIIDSNTTNPSNLTSSNTTLVDFVSNIEQIRGHLEQAISNKQAGNNILVLAHTLHPIEEIYSSIEGQLSNANSTLNQTLSSNLNQLSQMASNSTVGRFNTQAQIVNGLLNQTSEKVIPTETRNNNNNTAFNLMVIADLLSIAGSEYKEAVDNGTIKEIVEYQDAQGFVSRARSVFEQSSSLLSSSLKPQELSDKIQKIKESFYDLNNAIQNKSNPEVVNTSIRAIIDEISGIIGISKEVLGAGSQAGVEQIKVIAEIRNILNQTIQEYRQQNYNEAKTLAISAYLDNFEYIENLLAEKDKSLMQNIEVMLREQLRQMIQNKVSSEELQQHIDKINSNLDQAEKLLSSSST
jgi:hypothetical protein